MTSRDEEYQWWVARFRGETGRLTSQDVDSVATKRGRHGRLAAWAPYLLGAMAVWAAVLELLTEDDAWNMVEIVMILAALVVVGIARWKKWHEDWVATRILAELLRTQETMSGIIPGFDLSQTERMKPVFTIYGSEFWARAFAEYPKDAQMQSSSRSVEDIRGALVGLVKDQVGYHKRRIHRMERREQWLGGTTLALFAVSGFASLAHLLHLGGEDMAPLLGFFTAGLPALAGALHAINKHEDPEHLAQVSRVMVRQLEEVREAIQAARSRQELERLARRTAEILAGDVLGWRTTVGVQEVEVPA